MIDHVNGDPFFGPYMSQEPAIAGNPHITLPLAAVEGLPLGISLVGERWQDHALARIAFRLAIVNNFLLLGLFYYVFMVPLASASCSGFSASP